LIDEETKGKTESMKKKEEKEAYVEIVRCTALVP